MTVPQASVFQGITEEEWLQMESACSMKCGLYEKGRTIFRQGEPAAEMGVVLSGGVCIESVDLWGDRSILSHVPGRSLVKPMPLQAAPCQWPQSLLRTPKSSPSMCPAC